MYYHPQHTTTNSSEQLVLLYHSLTVYDSWNIKEFEHTSYVFCPELESRLTCAIFTGRR